jgi:hypothetical protein
VCSQLLNCFREIVLVDTEFRSLGNGFVRVRCVCALELSSGREHRLWIEGNPRCPYPIDGQTLFVSHYASAEIISHKSLCWPTPSNVLDTCIEFSALTSGLRGKDIKRSLIGALRFFHIDSLDVSAKQELRNLAMADKRNKDYTWEERADIVRYCWADVQALRKLLPKLEPYLCTTYRKI